MQRLSACLPAAQGTAQAGVHAQAGRALRMQAQNHNVARQPGNAAIFIIVGAPTGHGVATVLEKLRTELEMGYHLWLLAIHAPPVKTPGEVKSHNADNRGNHSKSDAHRPP